MKKAVQFGAGNIGRGFIGQLLFESGYETVFVDIKEDVLALLNGKRAYTLRIVGDSPSEVTIKNVRAVNSNNASAVCAEIASADILSTAVGANVLKFVAPLVAKGFEERIRKGNLAPLNIIICENLMNVRKIFRDMVIESLGPQFRDRVEEKLGFVEAVVSRMVPVIPKELSEKDPLLVLAEAYKELPVDRPGFRGEIPAITGVIPIDNFHAYEERKLFTHNAGHAIAAYLGYKKGYTYIYEAVGDAEIRSVVTGAVMGESGRALVKKHGFRPGDYEAHVSDLMRRFANVALGDTVARVGKDPVRKLKPTDRLIGGAKLALEYGIKPENFVKGINAALSYNNPEDKDAVSLQEMLGTKGLEAVLRDICGLAPSGELYKLITNA